MTSTTVKPRTRKPGSGGTADADQLTYLEGLEAVRKRPGMYIGSTDSRGMNHLVWEIVDNAVDEAIAGFCDTITVTFRKDGAIEVADNGRGIPTGVNTKTGMTGVEMAMTKLHAGGKFGGGAYKVSGGLHGVGASVVNALSIRMDVAVVQNGKRHEIGFQRGKSGQFTGNGPDAKFAAKPGLRVTGNARGSGTTVAFWADPLIFVPGSKIEKEVVTARMRQTAFLVPGLTIHVVDQKDPDGPSKETFKFTGGTTDMVEYLASDRKVSGVVHSTGTGSFSEKVPVLDDNGGMQMADVTRDVEVDISFRWGTGYDTTVKSFVNVVATGNGGTHVKGFERAVVAGVRKAMDAGRILKAKEDPPVLDDCLEGLTAVVSVRVPEPQFIGQTKDELGTPGVLKVVQTIVERTIAAWAADRKTKTEATTVLKKIADASRTRLAQKATKEAARRKTALEGSSMPPKLVDCRSTSTARSELFIVEGDSALGSAKQARTSEYQALLPIRGKILNVHKASLKDMLDNAECAAIVQVLGAGSGRSFDLDQSRYQRVLIMADADVDGAHIRCLLITLFYKYMRPFVEAGRLYATMPPLHKVEVAGRGGEHYYTYTADELAKRVAALEKAGKTIKHISRFKGLGEMDASQLWETTMDPSVRSVRQITVEDAEQAEAALDLTMGSEVAPRRTWIMESGSDVDLDSLDA